MSDLATAPDCAARLPLVVALGEAAVLPTAQAVLAARGPARECLIEALTTLEPAPKNPIVVDGAGRRGDRRQREGGAARRDRAGPGRRPPVAALAGAAGVASRPRVDDRARAARILGALDDEGRPRRCWPPSAADRRRLRAAVVQAASVARRVRAEAVLAAFAAAPQREDDGRAARAADLARILPAAVKRAPERRAEAIAALRARARRRSAVRAAGARRRGAGRAGRPTASPARRSAAPRGRLRRSGAALSGHARARRSQEAAGGAADPRPAAARRARRSGSARARDRRAGAGEAAATPAPAARSSRGAKQEPWPFVRRAELQALGRLCVAGGGDLMIRATERDVDEVRRAALIGLVRCKDPRARTILLRTLNKHDENASLRALSAGLLAEAGDRGAAPEVAAALHAGLAVGGRHGARGGGDGGVARAGAPGRA